MTGKYVIGIAFNKADPNRATAGFVVANASVASGKDTLVILSNEGARLAQRGYADDIHEEGFPPLATLMESFAGGGGCIAVSAPCFRKRGLDMAMLVDGASLVGGADLMRLMSENPPNLHY